MAKGKQTNFLDTVGYVRRILKEPAEPKPVNKNKSVLNELKHSGPEGLLYVRCLCYIQISGSVEVFSDI